MCGVVLHLELIKNGSHRGKWLVVFNTNELLMAGCKAETSCLIPLDKERFLRCVLLEKCSLILCSVPCCTMTSCCVCIALPVQVLFVCIAKRE